MNIEKILITVALTAALLIVAFLFQKKIRSKKQGNEVKTGEAGCSLIFYLFLGLLFIIALIAYIYYKKNSF